MSIVLIDSTLTAKSLINELVGGNGVNNHGTKVEFDYVFDTLRQDVCELTGKLLGLEILLTKSRSHNLIKYKYFTVLKEEHVIYGKNVNEQVDFWNNYYKDSDTAVKIDTWYDDGYRMMVYRYVLTNYEKNRKSSCTDHVKDTYIKKVDQIMKQFQNCCKLEDGKYEYSGEKFKEYVERGYLDDDLSELVELHKRVELLKAYVG